MREFSSMSFSDDEKLVKPVDEIELRQAKARAKKSAYDRDYYQRVIKNIPSDTEIVKAKKLAWQRDYYHRVTKNKTADAWKEHKRLNNRNQKKWVKNPKNKEKTKYWM